MHMPRNTFKVALASGQPCYGCWAGFASGYAAEVLATTGVDWLLRDGEHAPNTVPTLLAQLQAVQEKIRMALEAIHAAGKPSGILAPREEDARRYLEWGCTFVAIGIDISLLRQAALAALAPFKGGADAAPTASY